MAVADTIKLLAVLGLKDEFSGPARKITKSLDGIDAKLKSTDTIGTKIGKNIGTGIKTSAALAAGAIGFLATNVGLGLKSLSDLESITAQTNAALKSTKGVAGETADSIRNLAEKYEALNATIDDKVIQSGENLLLTFTNIRKDAFEPALQTALDMNAALGGGEEGLNGTVQKLGKALNDPVKGLTSLGRVGIVFTKQQKDQITTAVKAGDTFKAQGIILAELNKRFGGSFLAGGSTTTGKVAKFKDAIEDLQKVLAQALLPAIGKITDALSKFLADPKVTAAIGDLGKKIAGLFSDQNIAAGARFLEDAFKTAKEAAPIVESAARATFGLVQGAVGLFKSLPGPIQGLAVGAFAVNKLTGGLVTNLAGGLKDLIVKQRGNTPATPLFVSDVSGGGGPGGVPVGGKKTGINKAIDIVSKVFMVGIAIETINELANALGDQSKENAQATATQLQQVNQFGAKAASADLQKALDLINAKLAPTNDITPEGIAIAFNIDGIRDTLHQERDALVAAITKKNFEDAAIATGRRLSGLPDTTQDTLAGKLKDDIVNLSRLNRSAILDMLARLPGALKKANSPKDIGKAVKDAVHLLVDRKQGNLGDTQKILGELRDKLKNTHDPKTAAILRAAIHQVETKLPPRQLAITAVAKADGILKSNRSTGDKIKALQAIEKDLKDHKLPGATRKVEEKIAALRRSQAEAQHATTQAIKDKDMSPTINVPVVANSYITTNGITSAFHFTAALGSGRRFQG